MNKLLCWFGRHRWYKSGRQSRRCIRCGKKQELRSTIGPKGLKYYWE